MLKISIVTVCYNMKDYIEQTILSILSQGYGNLEYIIIDGGSVDGTQDILKKYSDRLAYYVSEPDQGMYDALRKGLSRATGDIIGWLNADDIYLPGAFKTLERIFSSFPEVEWLGSRTAFLSENGALTHVLPKTAIRTRKDIREGWCREDLLGYLMQEGMFWRRSLMEKAGLPDPAFRYAGDFEFWVRFAGCADIHYTDVPLAAFRRRSAGLSSAAKDAYLNEVEAIIAGKKRFPGFLWKCLHRNKKAINILRMLCFRRGSVIYYSYLSDILVKKTVLGTASPHTWGSLPAFDPASDG